MKKKSQQTADDLRPEYDFSSLPVVARGMGRKNPEKVMAQPSPAVDDIAPGPTEILTLAAASLADVPAPDLHLLTRKLKELVK